jgi:hypothetical protein
MAIERGAEIKGSGAATLPLPRVIVVSQQTLGPFDAAEARLLQPWRLHRSGATA